MKITNCADALRRHHFEVETVRDTDEAFAVIKAAVETERPETVSFGDSMSMRATGVIEWLRGDGRYRLLDGFDPAMTYPQRLEIRRQALMSDLFITGVNAVTEQGTLHWLDKVGNRIAPVAFGPRKVIIVAGRNKIVADRVGKKGIGFNSELATKVSESEDELMGEVTPQDLHKFGMIPEFVGRIPVICSTRQLDEDDLVHILTEPRNAIVKQYRRMFEIEGVELEFEDDALREMAHLALERKTGARGLRAIAEKTLQQTMFDVPSDLSVAKVVVTKAAVDGDEQPRLVHTHKVGHRAE